MKDLRFERQLLRTNFIKEDLKLLNEISKEKMFNICNKMSNGQQFIVSIRNKEYDIYMIKGIYNYLEFVKPSEINLATLESFFPKLVIEIFKNGKIVEVAVETMNIKPKYII